MPKPFLQHAHIDDDLYDYSGDFMEMWELKPDEGTTNGKCKMPYVQAYEDYSIPEEFERFMEWVNQIGYGKFDQILVHWYPNGKYYTEEHSDDEKQMVENSPIVIISFGATRTFRIKQKSDGKSRDLPLKDGDVIAMGGSFQNVYTHQIPKEQVKEPRISLTFRQFKKEKEKKKEKKKEEEENFGQNGSYWAIQSDNDQDQYEIETTYDARGHIASKYAIPDYNPQCDFGDLPYGINKTIHWIDRDFFDEKIKKNWEWLQVDEQEKKEMGKFNYDDLAWNETDNGIEVTHATSVNTINGKTLYKHGKYNLWEGEKDEDPPYKMDRVYNYVSKEHEIVFLYNGIAPIPKNGNVPGIYSNGIFMIL